MKKRYLCPVCDQELTAKSYCPECRRFRKEPVIYEGWLLPNESDQEGKIQGAADRTPPSPGQSGKTSASGKGYASTKQVSSGGRVYDSRYLDACGSGQAHTYGVPNQDPHKKKRGEKKEGTGGFSRFLPVLVILILVITAAAVLWEPVKELTGDFVAGIEEAFDGNSSKGQDLEEGEVPEYETERSEDSTDGVIVLSEEEVVAAGEPCNGYYHYDVDGEEYLAKILEYLMALWPEVPCEAGLWESNNQIYKSGDNSYSYYKRQMNISLDNQVYYTIVCDTATGELLEVSIWAEEEENFGRAFLLAACALEPERDRNEVWEEVKALLSEIGEEEEYYFEDWRISEVYLSGGTTWYGELTCLPEYDKYR